MERTVELILEGVKKIEMLANGKVRVLCVKEEVNENKVLKKEFSDDMFILIKPEETFESDTFKKIIAYQPTTNREKRLKALLKEAIEAKIENFYCTKIDPSLTEDGEKIIFEAGKMPAVHKSHEWWEKAAKEFLPERNSRLGTKLQYATFIGVLMLKLVEEKGMSVEDVWYKMCRTSKDIGHYKDSRYAKHEFEPTGSREICGFCDLANDFKLLAWSDEIKDYWLASGCYCHSGHQRPLAAITGSKPRSSKVGVGWLVLS